MMQLAYRIRWFIDLLTIEKREKSTQMAAGRPPREPNTELYSGRFAANLRRLREKAGLSVEEVVSALEAEGVSVIRQSWYRFEQGTRTPSLDNMPAIAKALGLKNTKELFPKD